MREQHFHKRVEMLEQTAAMHHNHIVGVANRRYGYCEHGCCHSNNLFFIFRIIQYCINLILTKYIIDYFLVNCSLLVTRLQNAWNVRGVGKVEEREERRGGREGGKVTRE